LLKYYRIGNYFSFHWSNCDNRKVNQFLKYSKPSSSSLLFLTRRPPVSLITPSASTDSTSAIHSVQLAIKDTNLPNIKIVQKFHVTLTLSAANLKSFIKNSCFHILAKARKCHFQDALDEWKINIF
jgi:hypothetical protein